MVAIGDPLPAQALLVGSDGHTNAPLACALQHAGANPVVSGTGLNAAFTRAMAGVPPASAPQYAPARPSWTMKPSQP